MQVPIARRSRSANCWFGRPYGPPIAFVLHTQTGGESGTVAEFLTNASDLSSHFVARLDGTVDCFIDPGDRAWGNGLLEPGNSWTAIASECGADPVLNPNHVTISCEVEDGGNIELGIPDAQFNAVLHAASEARLRYPSSLRFLARHSDISPQSRFACPGDRWEADGHFQALADAVGLQVVST